MKKNTKITSNRLKKKNNFQEKVSFYKNDIKNTQKTLKDVIGKTRINEKRLPKNITEKILPKI